MKRGIAWTLIALGGAVLLWAIVRSFTGFDPKGSGSLVFVAVLFLAVGWLIGDF